MAAKAKKIVVIVLLLAAVAAAAGYFMWNKPHQDVAATNSIKADAVDLYKTFITDSVAANKNYLQQVVEVKGMVNNISTNQQNQTVVTFTTSTEGAFINCTMEGKTVEIKKGNKLTLKGICAGIGQADADLGIMADIYLVRCYMVK